MVVLDTCALIEICKESPVLSTRTLNRIDEGAYILSISFAEIACKVKLGKLEMSISPEKLYKELQAVPALSIVAVDVELWFKAIALDWKNRDPADRLITSYAQQRKVSIVSSDKQIKAFYKKVIW